MADELNVDTSVADTGVSDAGAAPDTGATDPAIDPAQGSVDEFGQPVAPAEPSLDDLMNEFGPKPPDPNAPTDPQAPGALPESISEALGTNDYFTQPEHLKTAVLAAGELFDVENGKIPAHQMLEGFRARNPEGFNRIVTESLIPYIEHITGKKLGGEAASAVDPNTPEGRIARMEQERAAEREQQQNAERTRIQNETITRANTLGTQKIDELMKGTAFEGDGERMFNATIAQFAKMKMEPSKVMQETLAGNWTNFEKAARAAQQERITDAMDVLGKLKEQYKRQKSTLPGSKQSGANAIAGDFKLGPNSTKEEMAAYLRGEIG